MSEIILYDDEVLKLMQNWYSGQNDPMYAIFSTGGAGDARTFEDAIDDLDSMLGRVLRLSRNRFQLGKGTFTKKEIDELHTIRDGLAGALESVTGRVLEKRMSERHRLSGPNEDNVYGYRGASIELSSAGARKWWATIRIGRSYEGDVEGTSSEEVLDKAKAKVDANLHRDAPDVVTPRHSVEANRKSAAAYDFLRWMPGWTIDQDLGNGWLTAHEMAAVQGAQDGEEICFLRQETRIWHAFYKERATGSASTPSSALTGGLGDAITRDSEMRKYCRLVLAAPRELVREFDGLYEAQNQCRAESGEMGERRLASPAMDGDYAVQGLYRDGTISGGTDEWYDDEAEAIRKAKRMAGSSWFEGDYTRVITRDGELVWQSNGEMSERREEQRIQSVEIYDYGNRKDAVITFVPRALRPGLRPVSSTVIGNPSKGSAYRLIQKAKAQGVQIEYLDPSQRKSRNQARNRGAKETVRDYEVIDGRTDRHIGGPYKTRGEADDRRGPGDVVRFVPGKRSPVAREIFTRGDGAPIRRPERSEFSSDADYAQAFYAWKDEISRESEKGINQGLSRGLSPTKKGRSPKAPRSAPRGKKRR